jgi:protein-disulfide isomerase
MSLQGDGRRNLVCARVLEPSGSGLRLAVVASLSLVLVTPCRAQSSDSAADPLAGRVRGSPTAPVTVYEMSDFQCPYCQKFALTTYPSLDSAYVASGKVRWAFINFPLTSVHQNALAAAEVAVCAARQNAFWPVHDLLYRHQEVWAPLKEPGAFFLTLADSAKISRPSLLACVRSPDSEQAVREDAEGAERSGARSTPTFYIEGGLLVGAQPLSVFRQILDSILRVKSASKRTPSPGP